MQDKNSKHVLNEMTGLGVIISIGSLWLLRSFIIPFLNKMWFNFLMTRTKNSKFNQELTDQIKELTNLPLSVYVINDFKNYDAFHAGTKSIYISAALLQNLTKREAIAVLLHEAGHYLNNDSNKTVYLYLPIHKIIFYLILSTALAVTPLTLVLFFVSEPFFLKLLNKRSQRAEFLADSYASELGYGKELMSALDKFFNKLKDEVCKEAGDRKICEIKLFDDHKNNKLYQSHPDYFERKININSTELKYTKLALKHGKFKHIRKSYFELKKLFKKIKQEIKIEEEKINQKNLDYKQKKGL